MRTARTVARLRSLLDVARRDGESIGLVPTMGALHEGHRSLLRAARAQCDVVVMSLFVNPLQFGPGEDLSAYPRDEKADLKAARNDGVDVVFAPSVDEMYPPERATSVSVAELSEVLEGEFRPGHFDGVCTVVAKLLAMAEADRAYFGQKDAQQVAVVKRMAADLSFRTEIVVCPTVRAEDGLALSSRNAYLSPDERRHATVLSSALRAGKRALEQGGTVEWAERTMLEVFDTEKGVDVDYARGVDPDRFGPPRSGGPVLLVVAARVGPARLIDNVLVPPRS